MLDKKVRKMYLYSTISKTVSKILVIHVSEVGVITNMRNAFLHQVEIHTKNNSAGHAFVFDSAQILGICSPWCPGQIAAHRVAPGFSRPVAKNERR